MEVITAKDLASQVDVRLMASVYLKNSINRYWRNRRDSAHGIFSVLAHQLQSADILSSHRIFVILFRTLKELSTKRLTADQRNFAEIKLSDPIKQLSLENSVKDNLQTCADLLGESFNSAISRMHPAAFAQLKQALKM